MPDSPLPFRWPDAFKNQRLRLIWSLVSLAIVAALIVIALQRLSVAELWQAIQQAHWPWIAAAIVILVAGQGLRSLRMMRLLRWEAKAEPQAVMQGTMLAQVINWISPFRVGDVYRIWHIRQHGHNSWLWVASSTLIEKSADSLVLALFALALAISPMPNQSISLAIRLLATALAGVLAVSAALALRRGRWQAALFKRFPQLQQFAETQMGPASATFYAARLGQWLETAAISLGIWLLALATNWVLGQAFGLQLDGTTLLALVISLQTGTILSAIPGNIGVMPLITLAVLTAAGGPAGGPAGSPASIDPTIALAMGSAHYVLVYGINLLLCGLAFAGPWVTRKALARGLAAR